MDEIHGLMNELMNAYMNERASKWTTWINELIKQASAWMSIWLNEWVAEWLTECMTEKTWNGIASALKDMKPTARQGIHKQGCSGNWAQECVERDEVDYNFEAEWAETRGSTWMYAMSEWIDYCMDRRMHKINERASERMIAKEIAWNSMNRNEVKWDECNRVVRRGLGCRWQTERTRWIDWQVPAGLIWELNPGPLAP